MRQPLYAKDYFYYIQIDAKNQWQKTREDSRRSKKSNRKKAPKKDLFSLS